MYVEVHGNANARTQGHVGVATTGFAMPGATALKQAYPLLLSQARVQQPAYPAFELLLEPADRIFFTASCAKQVGILGAQIAPRMVHFELPRGAREASAVQVRPPQGAG